VISDIPSPADVPYEILDEDAPIKIEVLSSTANVKGYTTNFQKSVNLGIFVADLGYLSAYSQAQESIVYLKSSMYLANDLGIKDAFNEEFMENYQFHMGNHDSLAGILKSAYQRTESHLRSEDRSNTAALILCGGWLESLYLSTQLINAQEIGDDNLALYKRIFDQKEPLNNVIELLNAYNDSEDHRNFITSLTEIQKIYNNIASMDEINLEQVIVIGQKIGELRDSLNEAMAS